jgi:hypothetical protein
MRFETPTKELRQLVRGFNKGGILLPQFQRDYVWKPAKIRNLLDSLLNGLPIGGFYIWRPTGGRLDAKPKAYRSARNVPDQFDGYLIDGQQRLTSLEAAFGLYTGEDKRGAELRCYLDLAASDERRRDTRSFVSHAGNKSVANRVAAGDSTLIPVSTFFDGPNPDLRKTTEAAISELPGWNAKRVERAMKRFDRAGHMLDQGVPCTTIYDAVDEEAVEVFRRLNKGGNPLREGDVRAAELARGKTVRVLKDMRGFVAQQRPVRLGFGFSFAFRALVVFHRQSAQFAQLKPNWMEVPGPHNRTLSESWRATEKALNAALKFIDEEMGWSRRGLVPSSNAIIVLSIAFDKAHFKVNADMARLLRRWLCLTALRGTFQGSVETTLNRFAKAIRESKAHPAASLVRSLKRDGRRIRADELYDYGQMWGPATLVMHSWLVHRKARDWVTGDTIDALARTGGAGLPAGDLNVHHIFAREILSKKRFHPDEANSPANYALLSGQTNKEFGKKPADEVFGGLTVAQRRRAQIQLFSQASDSLLQPNSYEEFAVWRGKRLAEELNKYCGL